MGYTEMKNALLTIAIALIMCLIIMLIFLIIFIKNRKLLKQNTIKEYLKEYLEKYFNSQLVELDIKILSAETQKISLRLFGGAMFTLCLVSGLMSYLIEYFGFTRIEYIPFGILICGILVIGAIFMKIPGVKKIKLKNNVIELHNSNNELKSYQLEKINIKYNMRTRRRSRYINIYFSDDKYSSYWYGLQNYTPYIAFIIFVNLLKANEIEKIDNLNDEDIKRLQQNLIYIDEQDIV